MGYKTQNSVTQPIRHRYEEILCRQNSMQICTHSQDRMPYSLICGDIYRHTCPYGICACTYRKRHDNTAVRIYTHNRKGQYFRIRPVGIYDAVFGAASLFFGLGLILLSVARICPFAASFVYRLFQRLKNEAERSYPFPPYPCAEADGGSGAYPHIFPVRSDMPYRYAYVCTDNRQGLPQ